MARLSMRSRLLCAAGAILLLSSVPAAHPAFAQGHNDVIRNLGNTISPDDAQRRGRASLFSATGSRRRCYRLFSSIIYARNRNCGPPNSICAVNLANPLLDATSR
jgi:hypothetical protein